MSEKKKIMIIDDEYDFTEMMEERLKAEGFEPVSLNVSQHALEQVKNEMPDLILLDITMPYKDGHLVKDEIKSDEAVKNIPIIIVTAKQTEEGLIRDAKSSFNVEGCLIKPVPSDFLIEKINEVLTKNSN